MSQFGLPFPGPTPPTTVTPQATAAARGANQLGQLQGLIQQLVQFGTGTLQSQLQQQQFQMQMREQELSNELLAKRNGVLEQDLANRKTRLELARSDRKLKEVEKKKKELIEPALTAIMSLPPDQAAQVLRDNPIANDPALQDQFESVIADQKFRQDQGELLETIDQRVTDAPPGTPISEILNWDYAVEFTKAHTAELGYHGAAHYAKRVFDSVLEARKAFKLDEIQARQEFVTNGLLEQNHSDLMSLVKNTPRVDQADFDARITENVQRRTSSRLDPVRRSGSARVVGQSIYEWAQNNADLDSIRWLAERTRNNPFLKGVMGGGAEFDLRHLITTPEGQPGIVLRRALNLDRQDAALSIGDAWTKGSAFPTDAKEPDGALWVKRSAEAIEDIDTQIAELHKKYQDAGFGDIARLGLIDGLRETQKQMREELEQVIKPRAHRFDARVYAVGSDRAIAELLRGDPDTFGPAGTTLGGGTLLGHWEVNRQNSRDRFARLGQAGQGQDLMGVPEVESLIHMTQQHGSSVGVLLREDPKLKEAVLGWLDSQLANVSIDEGVSDLRNSSAYRSMMFIHSLTQGSGSIAAARGWLKRNLKTDHEDNLELVLNAYSEISRDPSFDVRVAGRKPFDPNSSPAFDATIRGFFPDPTKLTNFVLAEADLQEWAYRKLVEFKADSFERLRNLEDFTADPESKALTDDLIVELMSEEMDIPPSAFTDNRIERIRSHYRMTMANLVLQRKEGRIDPSYSPDTKINTALREATRLTFSEAGSEPIDLFEPASTSPLAAIPLPGSSISLGKAARLVAPSGHHGLEVSDTIYGNRDLILGTGTQLWRFFEDTEVVPTPLTPAVALLPGSPVAAIEKVRAALFGPPRAVTRRKDIVFELQKTVQQSPALLAGAVTDLDYNKVKPFGPEQFKRELIDALADRDEVKVEQMRRLYEDFDRVIPNAMVAITETTQTGESLIRGWMPYWNTPAGKKNMIKMLTDPHSVGSILDAMDAALER